ncbi:MAG: patatin-like phospholipase family protein [Saprospiraceae bacterium]
MNSLKKFPFTNLVLEGGGVKGIAYAGALKVLADKNILSQIDKVAGTSAGAISAALVSMRYTAAEIETIVNKTNFASFEDHKGIFHIATKYGLYRGDAFLDWMKKQISNKGIPEDATFADFAEKHNCLDLHVFATDLNMHQVKDFSYKTTPTTIVAEAVRASMSIPLFFEAWQFPNSIPDNHIYVDGGTVYNYPISAFDEGSELNDKTIGFHLDNLSGEPTENDLGYHHFFKYIKSLFKTLLDAQVIDFDKNKEQQAQTVRIDDFGISATNFKITPQDKQKLYDSGMKCATEFLEKYSLPTA